MSDSESSFMAIIFAIGVFTLILALGWRGVQNRRILRLRGANGQETIIVAREDDEISSVVTTEPTQPPPAPAPSVIVANAGVTDPGVAPEFGRSRRRS